MACCAFAAFILSQAIYWLNALRERLGFGPLHPQGPNPSALWTLEGGSAGETAPQANRSRWAVTTALAVAGGAGIGAIWFNGGPSELIDMTSYWCRSLSAQITY